MSIGFLSALKVIPWGEVINSAPAIVKGARTLFARTRAAPTLDPGLDATQAGGDPTEQAQRRVVQLETRVAELAEELRQLAQLNQSLAEQNARMVLAIDILRSRMRVLSVALGVLSALAVVGGVALSYGAFGSY